MGETRGVCFDPAPLLAQFPANSGDITIAERLGVVRETVRRWRLGDRRMQARTADAAAMRLGVHPSILWPDWDSAQGRCPRGHLWEDNEVPARRGRTCRACVTNRTQARRRGR